MKSELVYSEDGVLHITKPNGLRYRFENVDPPELGFQYDVLVYADLEVKVEKWDDERNFEQQDTITLTDEEKDACELYIENSEPPIGHSLNRQHIQQINETCHQYIDEVIMQYGFDCLNEVVYAGREGSAHPNRSLARRVTEYADAVWCCFVQVEDEINNTREDFLKSVEEYLTPIPTPLMTPDSSPQQFHETDNVI
tara:strand:- start:6525 stop:7115 length:591 start_codon:yes stop_codon:yes gene_type:complete